MDQIKELVSKQWGFLALGAWIALAINLDLIRVSPFALDEEASRALLLIWTVADNVVNPIVIFGVPDFRALLFAPIGAYWPGNLFAAKILGLVISFIAVAMLYKWACKKTDRDTALISSALLIISPALIIQTDSLSAGPYLLLGFAIGAWLDAAYRKTDAYFGGWYFLQLLWIAITTTIHPLALAYPAAIAWSWYKNPHSFKKSRHIFVGIAIATILAMLIHGFWRNIVFFGNPIESLSIALQGAIIWTKEDIRWIPGIICAALLVAVIILDFKNLQDDLLTKILISGIFIGAFIPDTSWALLCITLVLYRGIFFLSSYNQKFSKNSFAGKKGLLTVVILVTSSYFMFQDKNHALTIRHAILAPVDQLIQSLMVEANDREKPFIVATQWLGRTMIATKRDAFPLPPVNDDPEELLKSIKSVTHLAFDPYTEKNKPLADALGKLGGETETIALVKAGAIVAVRNNNVELTTQQRLALDKKKAAENISNEESINKK